MKKQISEIVLKQVRCLSLTWLVLIQYMSAATRVQICDQVQLKMPILDERRGSLHRAFAQSSMLCRILPPNQKRRFKCEWKEEWDKLHLRSASIGASLSRLFSFFADITACSVCSRATCTVRSIAVRGRVFHVFISVIAIAFGSGT